MKKNRLTEKQENFCRFYLETGGNASEAYRMSYDCANMQPATINRNAFDLINKSKIAARVAELREQRRKATESERKEVEARLLDIITADVSELYYTDPGTGESRLRKPWQLSVKMRHAVKAVRGSGNNISYEFHNKIDAVKALAKMNGWDAPQQVNVTQVGAMMGEIRIGFDDED